VNTFRELVHMSIERKIKVLQIVQVCTCVFMSSTYIFLAVTCESFILLFAAVWPLLLASSTIAANRREKEMVEFYHAIIEHYRSICLRRQQ
jgi:hypothetical protein